MTSGPRVCTSCNLAFRTPAQYYRHIRQKHRATFCARCVAHFPTPEAKEAHLRESDHHNQCPLCSSKASFFSRVNLERHMVLSHPGCGVCGQRFRTVDERNEHEASHPSCRICQVVLPDINAIDDHEASEHFKCHYCERFFDSHSNLVNHFKTHAAKDIPCPRCPRAFISHSALVLHFERNTCPGGMSMDWVNNTAHVCAELLGSHAILSPRGSEFPYKCPTCGCGAKYMSALLQHVESEACAEDARNGPLTEFIRYCEDGPTESDKRLPTFGGSSPPEPAVSHFFETEPFSGYSQPMNFFVMGHASFPQTHQDLVLGA